MDRFTWNPIHVPHGAEYLASKYRYEDEDGRRYRLDNMTSPKPRPNMTYEWKGHSHQRCGWRYSKETMAKLDARGANLVSGLARRSGHSSSATSTKCLAF